MTIKKIPVRMDGVSIDTKVRIDIIDDFDDIVGECGLWITQEQHMLDTMGIKTPEYTWSIFDKIKKRHTITNEEKEHVPV